jgi:uncharacterized protein (UPF0276 family)
MDAAVPTCLERDFNIPDLPTLTQEVAHIARLQQQAFATAPQRVQPQKVA